VDLSYSNRTCRPFDEFQRYKASPVISSSGKAASAVSYGGPVRSVKAVDSLPEMVFPGGALIGCDLAQLNFAKIKGSPQRP